MDTSMTVYRVQHIYEFLKLWWYFRHDAWIGAGPWEFVEADIQFARPRRWVTPNETTASSSGKVTMELRQ